MSLRYTGPNGDYPVYCCRVDRDQRASALCQEVRALPVDTLVECVLLDALAPDQIAIAFAAMGQLEEESRHLDRQWTLRRERARYEAERARRQYDTVEPENRLVARSLERAWEDKLRAVEAIEQEYARWRSEEPVVIGEVERASLLRLGENLPKIWRANTTSADERKRIPRFIVREVVLDQKRDRGQVWLKITWQTGAMSEHRLQRRVHTYRDYIDLDRLRQRTQPMLPATRRSQRRSTRKVLWPLAAASSKVKTSSARSISSRTRFSTNGRNGLRPRGRDVGR